MTVLLVALCGAGFGVGVILIWSSWTSPPAVRRAGSVDLSAIVVTGTAVVIGAALALVVTGWAVAAVAGGVAGWAATRAWLLRGHRAGDEQARIEALATWCEQLRDLLSAEHGVLGTVQATVATCPSPLRPDVARLAARLSRQNPAAAVRQFAADLDDPSGDLVSSVLLLAMSRSGRTAELLAELAATIRERAAMRLRVEAERSGQRSEARFVVGLSGVVIAAVVVFGQGTTFLDAYDSPSGQVVLAIVAVLFAAGFVWLHRLTRFERAARFLSVGEAMP